MHPGRVSGRTPRRFLAAVVVATSLLVLIVPPSLGSTTGAHPAAPERHSDASAGSHPWAGNTIHLTGSASPAKGSIPFNTTLTVQARSNLTTGSFTLVWNFSDGSPPLTQTIAGGDKGRTFTAIEAHTFASVATYVVNVNVSDDAIGDSPNSTTIRVVALPVMVMTLNFSPPSGDVGQKIVITPNVTGGAPPYHIAWSQTPSGCLAGASNLTCIAATPGQYSVRVTASDSVSDHVTVVANFTVNPRLGIVASYRSSFACNGPVGTGVFNFTALLVGGSNPVTVTWSFGDGTPDETGLSVLHTFPATGNYTVIAIATDAAGTSVSQFVTVSTGFPPCAAVSGPSYAPPLWVLDIGIGVAAAFVALLLYMFYRSTVRTRQTPTPPPVSAWSEGPNTKSTAPDDGTDEAGEPTP